MRGSSSNCPLSLPLPMDNSNLLNRVTTTIPGTRVTSALGGSGARLKISPKWGHWSRLNAVVHYPVTPARSVCVLRVA